MSCFYNIQKFHRFLIIRKKMFEYGLLLLQLDLSLKMKTNIVLLSLCPKDDFLV